MELYPTPQLCRSETPVPAIRRKRLDRSASMATVPQSSPPQYLQNGDLASPLRSYSVLPSPGSIHSRSMSLQRGLATPTAVDPPPRERPLSVQELRGRAVVVMAAAWVKKHWDGNTVVLFQFLFFASQLVTIERFLVSWTRIMEFPFPWLRACLHISNVVCILLNPQQLLYLVLNLNNNNIVQHCNRVIATPQLTIIPPFLTQFSAALEV